MYTTKEEEKKVVQPESLMGKGKGGMKITKH
jgi:hypothetical protein